MSDLVPPPRIQKVLDTLRVTKKPGDRVRVEEMGPTRASNVNWLLELGVIRAHKPDRREHFYSAPGLRIKSRWNQDFNEYYYVGEAPKP